MKQDELAIIKKSLRGIKYKQCLLFGSQAGSTESPQSDYDILLIVNGPLTQTEKFEIIARIRKSIAPYLIPVDIIVKSVDEVEKQKNLRGSIVRNALAEAIPL